MKQMKSLVGCRSLEKNGRISQVESHIFIEYLFVDPAVLFKDKSVIIAADKQNVADAFLHQVVEGSVGKKEVGEIRFVVHEV